MDEMNVAVESNETAAAKKRASISAEDFIVACFKVEQDEKDGLGEYTAERVAEITGLQVGTVKNKVKTYRQKYKIDLKEFPAGEKGARKLDTDALQNLLAKLRGK